eukprot:CCRYP_000914-RH/>CCRYP_000914-RH protein AED:0.49 eAED:1.00 QI:0/0/0/1/0/0/2/0/65
MTLTPRSIYLTELISLKSGTPVENKVFSSELVFALNADGLFGTGEALTDADSILRGMCGYNTAMV